MHGFTTTTFDVAGHTYTYGHRHNDQDGIRTITINHNTLAITVAYRLSSEVVTPTSDWKYWDGLVRMLGV